MKKALFTHFLFLLAYFIFIALFKKWIDLKYLPFLFGGVLGILLPELDRLFYVYLQKPSEQISQRVSQTVDKRDWKGSLALLSQASPGVNLIFHTIFFQIFFLILTFWVVTSSGNVFGMGIVLAFSLHLFIDQVTDYVEKGSIDNWFRNLPIDINLDREEKRWYLIGVLVVLLIFGFLL